MQEENFQVKVISLVDVCIQLNTYADSEDPDYPTNK